MLGTVLVWAIITYLLIIISLTIWFLKLHLKKSFADPDRRKSLSGEMNTEDYRIFEANVPTETQKTVKSTEKESFPDKK